MKGLPSIESYLSKGELPPWIQPRGKNAEFLFSKIYNAGTTIELGAFQTIAWLRIASLGYLSTQGLLTVVIHFDGIGLNWLVMPRPNKYMELPVFAIVPPRTYVRVFKDGPSTLNNNMVRATGWYFEP